jgi:ADP-heptose:LPS heptosyltransferase
VRASGCAQPYQSWPAEDFARVADTLARESGLQVVLTGSKKEIGLTSAVASHM